MEATAVLEKKKVIAPKLRFNAFETEWLYKSFLEMTQFINGKAFTQAELLAEGKYKVLRVGNLFSKSDWYYSDLELDENKYVSEGDLMYAWSASFGPHFWLGPKTIYHYHIWKVIPSKICDKQFLYYAFQVDLNKIKSQSQGGTMFHITKGNIEQKKFHFPSLPEQQKIASFLSAVDKKIQLLTRKKELLEQYKKGVMQQLFSGKLRFKDEKGKDYPEWAEKALEDIVVNIKSGKGKHDDFGEFALYGSTGIIGRSQHASHNGEFILIARVGANAGTINYVEGRFDVSDNTLVITCKLTTNINYLYYYLAFYNLNKLIFGSGQPLITGGQLKALRLQEPSLEEQKKIAEFLSALDKKIKAVDNQIIETQTFKKGLLQQMFV